MALLRRYLLLFHCGRLHCVCGGDEDANSGYRSSLNLGNDGNLREETPKTVDGHLRVVAIASQCGSDRPRQLKAVPAPAAPVAGQHHLLIVVNETFSERRRSLRNMLPQRAARFYLPKRREYR